MNTHTAATRPRVFICYSPEDAEFADWLSTSLRGLGHEVWVDQEKIPGGSNTFAVLQEALDESDVMLLVMTPEALRSRLVTSQWTYFYSECEKPLVPLVLRAPGATDKVNFMLASLQSIDFSRDYEPGIQVALGRLHNTLLQIYNELPNSNTEAVPTSYQTPDVEEDDFTCRQAGLLRVHHGIPTDRFVSWTQSARDSVRLLTTWTGLLYNQPHLFYVPVERGCSVQILLLNPSSAFARQRSLDIYLGSDVSTADEQEVPRNIQASIRQLADLYRELEGLPGRLELRLYDVMPSFSMHQCDDRALIGFFPHSARTTTFPMLEVETASRLGVRFNEEFDAIWNHATVIDLSPRLPSRRPTDASSLIEPLSARELEILKLIRAGLSNQEIARTLVVSMATVKKHINNLYGKLEVTSRTRAILRASELGLDGVNTPASPPSNSPQG